MSDTSYNVPQEKASRLVAAQQRKGPRSPGTVRGFLCFSPLNVYSERLCERDSGVGVCIGERFITEWRSASFRNAAYFRNGREFRNAFRNGYLWDFRNSGCGCELGLLTHILLKSSYRLIASYRESQERPPGDGKARERASRLLTSFRLWPLSRPPGSSRPSRLW
jgi:hypothetical protein